MGAAVDAEVGIRSSCAIVSSSPVSTGETPRPGRCDPAGALLPRVVQRADAAAEPADPDAVAAV